MTIKAQIDCIRVRDGSSAEDRISHIGASILMEPAGR